jgi:Dehydrogenases with different specificities (related to short-chain alcohol dehydrogenases)
MEGKVAVVTGGSSGVGRAIALAFAEHGAAGLVIADLDRDPREGGTPTDELATVTGVPTLFVQTDVSDPQSFRRAFEAASRLGEPNVLVNNAGRYLKRSLEKTDEADLDRLLSVNVKGTYFGCQLAASSMRANGGAVVNLASVASRRGSGGSSAYGATKGAVQAMTYALARELAPARIRVNAIHPGAVDTEMIRPIDPAIAQRYPWGPCVPQDIANCALFLACDWSSHISGTSVTVDGAAACMG